MGKRVYNQPSTTLSGPTAFSSAPAADSPFGSTYASLGSNNSSASMGRTHRKGRPATADTPPNQPEDHKKFSNVSFAAHSDAGSFFARDPREALALGKSVTGKRRSTATSPARTPNGSFSAVGEAASHNAVTFFAQDPRERIASGTTVSGLKQFDRRRSAFTESPAVKSRQQTIEKARCPFATIGNVPATSPRGMKPHGRAHGEFRLNIEKETVQPEVHRFRKTSGVNINRETTMKTPRSILRHVNVVHTPSTRSERGKHVASAKATNPLAWKVATPRPASAPTVPKVARLKLPMRAPYDASFSRNRFGPGSGRGMRPKSFVRKPSEQNSAQAKLALTQL
jgi:hypothetical protein